jgi:hypothetical protein
MTSTHAPTLDTHRNSATGAVEPLQPSGSLAIELLDITGATPFTAGGVTLTPVRRSKGVYVPLLCDIGHTTVTTAIEHATTFVTKLGLYPGSDKKLLKTYAKIADWCAEQRVERLADLVDDTAVSLICDLADVADLSNGLNVRPSTGARYRSLTQARAEAAERRQRAHRIRNILLSLRSATVLTHRRDRKQRLTDDNLAFGLPVLPGLEDRKGRPLTDEEILLGRFLGEIDRAERATPLSSLAYLIGETGIRPIESTTLDTDALDSRTNPTTITAPGAWEFGQRTVKLDRYVAATLPLLLTQLRRGPQPLTYTGASPGTGAATASLDGVIVRHLRRAGVTDAEVSPKSLSLWRVQRALVHGQNMKKARKYHGGATANVLADLKLYASEDDLLDGQVHLQRHDTEHVVASLAAGHFYDSSITATGKRKTRRDPGRRR